MGRTILIIILSCDSVMDGVFSPQPDLQVPEGNSGNSGDSIYNCNYVYCPPDFPFGLHQSTDVLTEYLLNTDFRVTVFHKL